jgi:hypothetical protein
MDELSMQLHKAQGDAKNNDNEQHSEKSHNSSDHPEKGTGKSNDDEQHGDENDKNHPEKGTGKSNDDDQHGNENDEQPTDDLTEHGKKEVRQSMSCKYWKIKLNFLIFSCFLVRINNRRYNKYFT